jgi:L-ribulose-5-phosphate 4-epimerase
MLLESLRREVVAVGKRVLAAGLVRGTAGNFSARDFETGLIVISPSGMPYPELRPEDVVVLDISGEIVDGARTPSSETPMHLMLYRERPDTGAVVHTHSHYSTVVSCIRDELPVLLTEFAVLFGGPVPVTRYAPTATEEIARSVIEAMPPDGQAVLLRNHGLVVRGADFEQALAIAEVVEDTAKVYVHALAANGGREPNLVPAEVIPEMRAAWLAQYGQPKEG